MHAMVEQVICEPTTIYGVTFSSDSKLMACATGESVKVYETTGWRPLGVLNGHERAAGCVRFFPDGKTFASCDYRSIRLWDLETFQQISVVIAHTSWVYCIAVREDGEMIASVGNDDFLKVWEVGGLKQVAAKRFSSFVQSVAFAPREDFLAVSCGTAIRFFDIATMKEKRVLKRHKVTIQSIAFSPNGKWIASGGGDATTKIWLVESGLEKWTIKGHSIAVRSLMFSPDSHFLATAGDDGSVRIWNVADGCEVELLKFPDVSWLESKAVKSVSFSADGRWLAAGGSGKSLIIWRLNRAEEKTMSAEKGTNGAEKSAM